MNEPPRVALAALDLRFRKRAGHSPSRSVSPADSNEEVTMGWLSRLFGKSKTDKNNDLLVQAMEPKAAESLRKDPEARHNFQRANNILANEALESIKELAKNYQQLGYEDAVKCVADLKEFTWSDSFYPYVQSIIDEAFGLPHAPVSCNLAKRPEIVAEAGRLFDEYWPHVHWCISGVEQRNAGMGRGVAQQAASATVKAASVTRNMVASELMRAFNIDRKTALVAVAAAKRGDLRAG